MVCTAMSQGKPMRYIASSKPWIKTDTITKNLTFEQWSKEGCPFIITKRSDGKYFSVIKKTKEVHHLTVKSELTTFRNAKTFANAEHLRLVKYE